MDARIHPYVVHFAVGLILASVVMFVSRQNSDVGRAGRVLIGLGLITLALLWVSIGATMIWTAESVWLRLLLLALVVAVLPMLPFDRSGAHAAGGGKKAKLYQEMRTAFQEQGDDELHRRDATASLG